MSTSSQELTVLPPGEGPDLEATKRADAPAIWQSFATRRDQLLEVSKAIVIADASEKAQIVLAGTTRKQLKALRCEVERKREELVEGYNKATKQINTAARSFKLPLEAEEDRLEQIEKFAENQEKARKAELSAERGEMLRQIDGNPAIYDLGEMSDEEFDSTYSNLETTFLAKQEEARKAEEARIAKAKADAEERERIHLENERLKAEAAKAEAAAKAEREAAAKALREEQEKAAAERAAAEAKARAEREAVEGAALKERQAREKAEAELKAKQDAERRQREADEEAARKAAAAPDKEKLIAFAATVRALAIPDFTTGEMKTFRAEIMQQKENLASWLERKASVL